MGKKNRKNRKRPEPKWLNDGGNRFCKACGKSFTPVDPRGVIACSTECIEQVRDKPYACKPRCSENDLYTRVVYMRNGTDHLQQACEKCQKTKLLPKAWGIAAGLIEKPKPPEAIIRRRGGEIINRRTFDPVETLIDLSQIAKEAEQIRGGLYIWNQAELRFDLSK